MEPGQLWKFRLWALGRSVFAVSSYSVCGGCGTKTGRRICSYPVVQTIGEKLAKTQGNKQQFGTY